MKIVAVTACPTGIAHTYMAAEKLEQCARRLGHQIKVETQGAIGIENPLAPEDIAAADAAVFAADIAIEAEERFARLPRVAVGVQEVLRNPDGVFKKIADAIGKNKK